MANLKNAKKAILVNERNRRRNQAVKTAYKTAIKNALAAISENTADAADIVRAACRTIDKTAGKGVVKKQTAARKKSNLMTLLNNAGKAPSTEAKTSKKAASKKTTAKKTSKAKTAKTEEATTSSESKAEETTETAEEKA